MDESNEASLHSDVSKNVVTDAPVRSSGAPIGQPDLAAGDSSFANSVGDNHNGTDAVDCKDNQAVDNQVLSCDSLSSEASNAVESSEPETQSDDPKSEASPTKSSKSKRHVSFSASPSVYPIENLSEYNSYEPRSSMCRSSSSSDRLRFLSGCDVITAVPSLSSWSRGVTQVPQICKVLDAQPQPCIMSKAVITSTPLADIRDVSRISSDCQNMASFSSIENNSASSNDGLSRSSSNFRSKIPGFAHSITYEEERSALFKGQAPLQLSPTKKPFTETQTDEPDIPESRISQIKQRLSRKVSPKNVNENVLYSPKRSQDCGVGGASSIPRVPYTTVAEGICGESDSGEILLDTFSSLGSDGDNTSGFDGRNTSPMAPNTVVKEAVLQQRSPTKASPPASIIASKGAIAALARGPKTKTLKVVPIPSKVKIEAPRIRAPESNKVVSPNNTNARNCFNEAGNVVSHTTAPKERDFIRDLQNGQVRFIPPDMEMNRVGREEDVPNPFRPDEFSRDEVDAICQQATAVAANIARTGTPDTISNLSSPSIDSIDTLLCKVRVSSDDVEGMNFGPSVNEAGPSLSNDVSMESIQQWSLADDSETKNTLNANSNDAAAIRDNFFGRGTEESISKNIYKDVHSVIIEECESDKDVDGSTLDTDGLSLTDNVRYFLNDNGETNGNICKIDDQTYSVSEKGMMSQDINESNANEIKPEIEISHFIDADTNEIKRTVTEETVSAVGPVLSLEFPGKNIAQNSLSFIGFTSSRKIYGSLESNDGSSEHSESESFVEAPSPSDILDIQDRESSQDPRAWKEETVMMERVKKSDESSCAILGNQTIDQEGESSLHLQLNTNNTIAKPGVNENGCAKENLHQSSEEDASDGSFCSAVSPGDVLHREINSLTSTGGVAESKLETCPSIDEVISSASVQDDNDSLNMLDTSHTTKSSINEVIGSAHVPPTKLETYVNKNDHSCTMDDISSKTTGDGLLNNSEVNEETIDKPLLSQGITDGNNISSYKLHENCTAKVNSYDESHENISNTFTENEFDNISKQKDFNNLNEITELDPMKSDEEAKPRVSSKVCDKVNDDEPEAGAHVVEKTPCETLQELPVKKVSNIVSLFSNKDDPGSLSSGSASPLPSKPVTVKLRTSIPVLSGGDTKVELVETKSGQACVNLPGSTNSLLKYKKKKTFSSRKAIFEQLEKAAASEPSVRRSSLNEETGTNSGQMDSVDSRVSPGGSQSARSSPDKDVLKKKCTSIIEEKKNEKSHVISTRAAPQEDVITTPIDGRLTRENVKKASLNLDMNYPKETSSCDSDVESASSISAHLEKEVPLRISSPESDFDQKSIKGNSKTSIKTRNISRSKMPKYNPTFSHLKVSKNIVSDSVIKKANQFSQDNCSDQRVQQSTNSLVDTKEVEPVISQSENPSSRVVRSPRTCMKFSKKTTPSATVVGSFKQFNNTSTDCPDSINLDRRRILKTYDTVSTSSETSTATEISTDLRNRTTTGGSKLKKRPLSSNKMSVSSHKSSSSSTDTSTAEEIFYKSSLEIKLQGQSSSDTTSSTEFGRRFRESSTLRSKLAENTSSKPCSAFRHQPARYVKKIELKSFRKECINELETSVSSQETTTCLSSSTASMSSVETEGSHDCELSQLIENLEKEHEDLQAKTKAATPRRARPSQTRVRKVPRVQKLISRFEKP